MGAKVKFRLTKDDVIFALKAGRELTKEKNPSLLGDDRDWKLFIDTLSDHNFCEPCETFKNAFSIAEQWTKKDSANLVAITSKKNSFGGGTEIAIEFESYKTLLSDYYRSICVKDKFYTDPVFIETFLLWLSHENETKIPMLSDLSPTKIAYAIYHTSKKLDIQGFKEKLESNEWVVCNEYRDQFCTEVMELARKMNIGMFSHIKKIVSSENGIIYYSVSENGYSFFAISKNGKLLNITPLVAMSNPASVVIKSDMRAREIFDVFCLNFFNLEFKCHIQPIELVLSIGYEAMNFSRRFHLF